MPAFPLVFLALAAAPAQDSGFAMFDRFVGHCWEGAVAEGATDLHCFDTIYDGAYIRDRHRVTQGGKVVYEGETFYSREIGHVTFTYFNSLGGIGRGEAKAQSDGICFEGMVRAEPAAQPAPIATCWRWQSDGSYLTDPESGDPVLFVLSKERFE